MIKIDLTLPFVLELFGTISSLLYIYFSVKANKWLWLFGLLAAIIYGAVFFLSKFYAQMGLQLYYVFISIYGWWLWKKGNSENSSGISKASDKQLGLFVASIAGFFVPLFFILNYFSDSPVPFLDSALASASIVATWMLARKIVQHWLIWIVVDFASVIIYISQDLYITGFLYAVFTIMAVKGYFEWQKQIALQSNTNEKG